MDVTSLNAGRTSVMPTDTTGAKISADFEMFLRMLTVQLKNQDPLNPVESADYAVQLATFSGVEQQVLTNDLLKDMMAQGGVTQLAQMGDWVGREVRAPAPADFTGSPLTIWTAPVTGADAAQLVVFDAAGAEVQRLTLPLAAGAADWAGTTRDGAPLPNGRYSFVVESFAGETRINAAPAEIYARVKEVRSTDTGLELILSGDVAVDSKTVTALREG